MTLVFTKNNKPDTRFSDYEREIVKIGLDLAKKRNERESLDKEIGFLSSFRDKVVKGIVYEESGELKISGSKFKEYDQLLSLIKRRKGEIEDLLREKLKMSEGIIPLQIAQKNLKSDISSSRKLLTEIQNLKDSENKQIVKMRLSFQEEKSKLTKDITQKKEELKKIKLQCSKEMESVITERNSNKLEREFLARKAIDLGVYERRMQRNFEKMFPGEKMKFI